MPVFMFIFIFIFTGFSTWSAAGYTSGIATSFSPDGSKPNRLSATKEPCASLGEVSLPCNCIQSDTLSQNPGRVFQVLVLHA